MANCHNICVLGKFDKEIYLLSLSEQEISYKINAHIGGVTSIKFKNDDQNYFFSSARKDNLIYLWDLRKPDKFVCYFNRLCNTNQRMNFAYDSEKSILISGSDDG